MFGKALFAAALIALAAFGAAVAQQPDAIKRTPLQRVEFPSGHLTIVMQIDVAANAAVARHVHPGIETGYVLEGESELMVDGRPPQRLKPGDTYEIPAGVPHSAQTGAQPTKIVATFVVDKTKPLASPAP